MLDAFAYEFSQVSYSCSVLMSGQMWVFGGAGEFKRQLSSVGQCHLKTEGTLPFDLDFGAANIVDGFNGAETALLCFDHTSPYNACNSYVHIFKKYFSIFVIRPNS